MVEQQAILAQFRALKESQGLSLGGAVLDKLSAKDWQSSQVSQKYFHAEVFSKVFNRLSFLATRKQVHASQDSRAGDETTLVMLIG